MPLLHLPRISRRLWLIFFLFFALLIFLVSGSYFYPRQEKTGVYQIKPITPETLVQDSALLEDASERINVSFAIPESPRGIHEAVITAWAFRLGIDRENLKEIISRGPYRVPFKYTLYDEEFGPPWEEHQVVESRVDVAKPAKIIVWDKPYGFGAQRVARAKFEVVEEQLFIYVFVPPEGDQETGVVDGIFMALQAIAEGEEAKPLTNEQITHLAILLYHHPLDRSQYIPAVVIE